MTVLAVTADGGKAAGCHLSVACLLIDNTAFIKAVDTQCEWTVEPDGTVKLTPENRKAILKVTDLDVRNKGLTDLSGIEYFTGLKILRCSNNELTSLDMPSCPALMTLDCNSNQLTKLDVSNCTALAGLVCYENQLTSLDVSANTALRSLWCNDNRLMFLDVTVNMELAALYCGEQTSDGSVSQELKLLLPEALKARWEGSWKNISWNRNVTATVKTAE